MKRSALIMTFILIGITTNIAKAQPHGTCGVNLTWQLVDSTLTISGNGKMYDYTLYYGSRPWDAYRDNIKILVINSGVTAIGEHAFHQSFFLRSVTIPNSVTKLGRDAFFACSSLTTIDISNYILEIGRDAFAACSSLMSINVDDNNPNYSSNDGVLYNKTANTLICCPAGRTEPFAIPEFVTAIADYAFRNCRKLTSITIPSSVASIGIQAFSLCTSMTAVNVATNNINYSSNDGILYNESQDTLICCPAGKMGAVTIPNTVVTIIDYAFYFNQVLTAVIIPNSVDSVGFYAFSLCGNLKSLTIGSSVTEIGYGAFSYCYSLDSITCRAEEPLAIYYNMFYDVPLNARIIIPCNTLSAYQNSSWGDMFTNFIEDCAGIGSAGLDEKIKLYPNPVIDKFYVDCNDFLSIKIYDMSGKEVVTQEVNGKTEINISNLPKGIYTVSILSKNKIIKNDKIVKL